MQEASAVSVATQKKRELDSSFFKKGIMVALFSSLMYGFYTAFVTAGQNSQLWTSWTSALNPTAFLAVFIAIAPCQRGGCEQAEAEDQRQQQDQHSSHFLSHNFNLL